MKRRSNGEGTIRLRSDGRWEGLILLELPSGYKRFTVYGKTRGEASRKLVQLHQKYKANELNLNKAEPLRDYLKEWWPSGQKIKTATYLSRELNTRRISNVIGHIPLDEVSVRHIKLLDKHLSENGGREGRGLSASSRKQALAILRSALGAAYADSLIAHNPFRKWQRSNTPQSEERPSRVLTMTEKKNFFSLGDKWTSLWKLQLLTGNRSGETLALAWDDLELPKEEGAWGRLHITKSIHRRKIGMPEKASWLGQGESYYLDKPKTKTSKRTIALDPYAVGIFKDIKVRQEAEAERIGMAWGNPKGFVFTRDAGEPLTPDMVWHGFQFAADKAELGSVNVHDLRHTMITDQINKGMQIAMVSKMVGHSSVAFTMHVYGHLTEEVEYKVAETASKVVQEAERLVQLQAAANAQ